MGLIDLSGAPLKAPRKKDLTEEIAATTMDGVRQIQTGHPADGLTPYRLGALLREADTHAEKIRVPLHLTQYSRTMKPAVTGIMWN